MLLNESSILANIYSGIINEDLQSSLNQTRNILKNNGVENADKILKDLQGIYDSVTFQSDEHQSSRSDQDIPSLAFLILAGYNLNVISEIYNKYCNTKSLYSKSSIIQWSQNVKNTIQTNKWFKPSEEKTKYIQDEAIKLIELIHRYYVPIENKTEQSDYKGSSDDIVFNNDKLIIYRADNMDKCILYGEKNLCISYPKKDNYYWRYRLGKMRNDGQGMTTYFVNWKDSGKKILIDALGDDDDGGSGEYSWNPISPNTDSDISSEELIRKFRELEEPFDANVFQFVEYGENEKRAYEIDENIDSILDNKLNGYSDYDIFVQLDKDISNYEWENLRIDDPTKSILLKKYMGGGGLVSLDIIKKYGDLKDLNWYEDILSRNKGKSIEYYLSADGNVSNSAIKNIYNKEKIRVDELGVNVRKFFDGSIYLRNADLYFLPNLEDLEVEDFDCSYNDIKSLKGSPRKVHGHFDCSKNQLQSLKGSPRKVNLFFNCSKNQLQSLEGAPQEVGGNFNCSNNQLQSLKGAPQEVGGAFNCVRNQLQSLEGSPQEVGGSFLCYTNQLQSLKGAPQKVGGNFDCSNNQLKSLEGKPEIISGFTFYEDNPIIITESYDLNYFIDRLGEIHK